MQTASLYKLWFLLLMLGILTVPAPVLLAEESKAPGKPDPFPFPIKVDVKAGETEGLPNRVQNPASGMWYALVPGGTYSIGSDQVWDSKEIQVQMSPYYISETCVTRSQLGPELWKHMQQADWHDEKIDSQVRQFPEELQVKFRLLEFMMTYEDERGIWRGMLELNPDLARDFDAAYAEFLKSVINDENPESEKEKTLEEGLQSIRLSPRQKQTIKRVQETVSAQLKDPQRGQAPYDQASDDNAVTYAEWQGVDLPTEAQWEIAARLASANKLKVHHMVGNHWEYCSDFYAYDYYQRKNDFKDPTGPRKAKWSSDQLEREKKAELPSSLGLFNWLLRLSVRISVLRGGSLSGREYYPSKIQSPADSEKPHRIRLVINPRQK
ncbi:MAG: hypothetical protein CME32_06045 [Gimesia sp.]|nr:hypothetical protein [Gimesia sp.]